VTSPISIPLGAWEPDGVDFQSSSLMQADNVTPIPGGYGPSLGFNPSTSVLTPPIKGASVISDSAGAAYVYAGSGNQIYVSNNGAAFASVYTSGSTLSAINRWQFARFVGKVIGVHPQNAPVSGDIGSAMTVLGGTPPVANVAGVVGNFLVLGDLVDGIDGVRRNRIRWSGFRNPATWGTNVGTQADFNDMPDEGGVVQGIIGREFGTIFQRYAISRMTYVGSPVVFQFDQVEKKRGALAPGCIIDAGLIAAYIADDGFFLWDGTSSTPIGAQRVNTYFRERLYPGGENYITGYFDPLSSTIGWAYPTDATLALNERLIYSLTENRWTRSTLAGAWFMTGFDVGYTLGQMDQFGPIGDIPFSFDDPKLKGGRSRAVGFNTAGAYGGLNGPTLEAVFLTGEWQAKSGSRAFVNALRPVTDAADVTCAAGVKAQMQSDAVAYTSDASRTIDGKCPIRANGRFMRFKMDIAPMQTWAEASAIEASVAAEGRR